MKRKQGSTLFLKVVLLFIGMAALAVCIFALPEVASRDAAAHPETAYLQYPFLLGAYSLAIPFFVALYQAFNLLSYIDRNEAFSTISVRALRIIKVCAITVSTIILIGFIICVALFKGKEDITGIFMLVLIGTLASSVIATFAAVLQKLLHDAIEIKSEIDLTV